MTEVEFIQAITRHMGIIQKVLYIHLDDKSQKEDLLQEIQLQAWKAMGNFRGEAKFSTWLYRVALNTVFTHQRKKRVITTDLPIPDAAITTEPEHNRSDILMAAIKALNDIDRSIIMLHLEDYNNDEISDIMGMTKNHIAVKLHRIKQNLHRKLNPEQNG